ncbi:MAG: FAD binding domain-containing protein [Anaerolineaceae bacterium]|nr:FAD binding domain-containing protein [Anaerolineaceae bacterium]
MWQAYHSVSSLDEALALLAQQGERARIVAGGTDMLIELERGQRPDVEALVDITRVPGLDSIGQENGRIRLGPLVTHNHVLGSDMLRELALPLVQASQEVGAPQIRNRATIAGNLITASPANDTITPLMALCARVRLRSHAGERQVALADFYTGLRRTVMRPDELMTEIEFPAMRAGQRGIFLKLGLRRAQAIAVINLAIVLELEGHRVKRASIMLGSVAPTILRAENAEQALVGQTLDAATIEGVADLTAAAPSPIDDVRGSAVYRRRTLKTLTRRALRLLAADEQGQGLPQDPAMLWGPRQALVTAGLPSTRRHGAGEEIVATINGERYRSGTGQHKSLLRWLREDAGLTGTKEGCAEGECGACTVLLDDVAVMACMVPAPRAHGADIVTVEGLAGDDGLHPVQQAFIEHNAVQCGYCTPGFLVAGASLLAERGQPTEDHIRQSFTGNLCRCTGYYKIVEAMKAAAGQARSGADADGSQDGPHD